MFRRSAVVRLAALGAVLTLVPGGPGGPAEVRAQVTSPGPLSTAHADWAGDCSRCHEIGTRGIADARCLACHTPLAARIERGRGYHADRAGGCASCHREHRGEATRPVSFEPAGFDHAAAGYALEGAHLDVDCAGCHNTLAVREREVRLFKGRYGALSRTFLGLLPSCVACHAAADDPHGEQFEGRECGACHGESRWERADRFDHASAAYPLTGRHVGVACAGCHRTETPAASAEARPRAAAVGGPAAAHLAGATSASDSEPRIVYRPVDHASCASCHGDAHRGAMGASCSGCHATAGWRRIPRNRFEADFDHTSTGFTLLGLHAAAPCGACHAPRADTDPAIRLAFEGGGRLASYPRPAAGACASCHLDGHQGVFGDVSADGACASCHTEAGWEPSAFDVFRHETARLALDGAHRVVPCADCHRPGEDGRFVVRLGTPACAGCHAAADPHEDQFAGRDCASCHDTGSFRIAAFDHSASRFPLDGAHEEVACAACHPRESRGDREVVRYRPLATECRACHTDFGDHR